MKQQRVTKKQLRTIWDGLTELEQGTMTQFQAFHFSSGSQMQRILYGSTLREADTRNRNRVLKSLVQDELLMRLPRKAMPGSQNGSTEYIYTLSPLGHRLMWPESSTKMPYTPPADHKEHIEHAIEVTEVYARLKEAFCAHKIEDILYAVGEPGCHVQFETIFKEKRTVKSDARFLFTADYEGSRCDNAWFLEVERSMQGEALTIEKIQTYTAYEATLSRGDLMPNVLFVAYTPAHKAFLDRLFDNYALFARNLFHSAFIDNAVETMLT